MLAAFQRMLEKKRRRLTGFIAEATAAR